MREIKFRAWYQPEGYMLTGEEMKTGLPGSLNEYFVDRDYAFMQYTGLKDKSGAEIYEGDIVHFCEVYDKDLAKTLGCDRDEKVDAVKWSDATRRLEFYGANSAKDGICQMHQVIGNIHENP